MGDFNPIRLKYCLSSSLHTVSTVNRSPSNFSLRLQTSSLLRVKKRSSSPPPVCNFERSYVLGTSSMSNTEHGQAAFGNMSGDRGLKNQIRLNSSRLPRTRRIASSPTPQPSG